MERYLITGAIRGIGRAIAEKLEGLLLHGRDTVALAEVCKSVKHHCAHVVRLIHALAVPSGVSEIIHHVGRNPLNLLVNNAGIAIVKPFCEITSIEWEQAVGGQCHRAVHVDAAFCPRDAAGFQHRQHSFHRSEDCVPELERLLHEQVRARRFLPMRARRIARPQNSRHQRLSHRYKH